VSLAVGASSAPPRAQTVFRQPLLNRARKSGRASESSAEETRQLSAEHDVEPRSGAATRGASHPIEGGAVVEKAWGRAFVQDAVPVGGVHAQDIGAGAVRGDPWRE